MHYLIIGNSAAGVQAAQTLRQLDRSGDITIVDAELHPAYSRCLLPNLIAGTRQEEGLFIRGEDFYRRLKIRTLLGEKVSRVHPAASQVELEGGMRLTYDRLLVATGSSSALPPLPGVDGPGVFGLRNLADARQIIAAASEARRAVVVGAGLVGLETAVALYRRGLEVTVVEKMPQILPQQFDARAAAILQRELQAEGVRFILGQGIREVLEPSRWQRLFGTQGRGVLLEDGQQLRAELVVLATGVRPNTGLLEGSGVEVARGVVVNSRLETSVPGIYAAGDVAESVELLTGERMLTPIWPNAVAQGKVAAWNMAGRPREHGAILGMQNAVEFRAVPAIAVGMVQAPGEDCEVLQDYRPGQKFYKKLVLRDNRLVGICLVGDIRQAGVYAALIRKQADVGRLKGVLLREDFGYGHLLPRPA